MRYVQHIATRVPAAIGTLISIWLPDKVTPAGMLAPPIHGVSVTVSVAVSRVKVLLPIGAVASVTKG